MLHQITWLILISLLLISCQPNDLSATPTVIQKPDSEPILTEEIPDEFLDLRKQMVSRQIEARGVSDPNVLTSMLNVKRHLFVPEEYIHQAYADHPLPIGYGQTISQPYIVALMTEIVQIKPGDRVLEVGTGSGYQAAILAEMGAEVFTVEIIPELAESAEKTLNSLAYDNVKVRASDGYFGWEEYAPFEAIVVTAAPDHLPQPLVDQLAEGGRMVIPIGPIGSVQTLWLFEKVGGELKPTNLGGVRFVPFLR
jgi:protein-L-isoaspartate(D-aspartate) O-methyltransferase